ncbi:MAG: SipW-dependent-type signal peptide-containing protein [Oscillospiraceae bacterium]|nr:SipW-dependent-type signal peptide-containing protein [Oscillospiraceae bacterium]
MDKSKLKTSALLISLAALAVIGGTAAFLTSSDMAANQFTVGKVDLKIEEKFDDEKTLAAGEKIQKQPWVKNTGTVDQLFFVELYVPCMEVTFLDTNGQRIAPEGTTPQNAAEYRQMGEIFDLIAEGDPEKAYLTSPDASLLQNYELSYNTGTASDAGWIYLEQTQTAVTFQSKSGFQDGTYNAYLFGYSGTVGAGHKTIPLFDELRLRSFIDAEADPEALSQVSVVAYTLQADELDVSGLTGNGKTALYTNDDLRKIFTICHNKAETAQGGA